MNLDEFTHLLERYGTKQQHWPEADRAVCQQLLQTSSDARSLLASFAKLERTLDAMPPPAFPGLETRIRNQTLPDKPLTVLDRLVNSLMPGTDSRAGLGRLAATACLALVLGIVVGNYYSFGFAPADDGFQYWGDELLMLSFSDISGSQP